MTELRTNLDVSNWSAKIIHMNMNVFSDDSMRKTKMKYWFELFQADMWSIENDPRSGSLLISKTLENNVEKTTVAVGKFWRTASS